MSLLDVAESIKWWYQIFDAILEVKKKIFLAGRVSHLNYEWNPLLKMTCYPAISWNVYKHFSDLFFKKNKGFHAPELIVSTARSRMVEIYFHVNLIPRISMLVCKFSNVSVEVEVCVTNVFFLWFRKSRTTTKDFYGTYDLQIKLCFQQNLFAIFEMRIIQEKKRKSSVPVVNFLIIRL